MEIDQLFVLLFILLYISTPSWSTHASPASTRTSHLWFHNDKLAQRILDPMTFDYLLAIENTQRTKPSWQRMNNYPSLIELMHDVAYWFAFETLGILFHVLVGMAI